MRIHKKTPVEIRLPMKGYGNKQVFFLFRYLKLLLAEQTEHILFIYLNARLIEWIDIQ